MQYYKFIKKIGIQEMPTLPYVIHLKAVVEHKTEKQIKNLKIKFLNRKRGWRDDS